jgi:hypothetical protein
MIMLLYGRFTTAMGRRVVGDSKNDEGASSKHDLRNH